MITITKAHTKSPLGLGAIGLACLAATACGGNGNKGGYSSQSTASSEAASHGFEATISDFANYQNWPLIDYTIGNASQGLKGAHRAGSDQYLRKTFANGAAQNSTAGEFDQGAIFIKETFTYERDDNDWHKAFADQGGLLAMVKRGGDFNPDHGGWEWFMLSADLSEVVAQGADLMNGACNGCHSQAEMLGGIDYRFPKPTEFVIDATAFADYTEWDMVEFTTEDIPNLGSAHQFTGDTPPLRRIFQKQVLANPEEAGDFGYPIGTVIVKDVLVDNQVKEIVAMVKRGGKFAPATSGWEWFMLNSNDPSQVAEVNGNSMRGDLAMCTGCHSKAADADGTDYVFSHSYAPFNTRAASEFIATKADLENYLQWPLTDYALGASNPFIGNAHAAGNSEFARAVFQNGAANNRQGDRYEQGSIIIKETFSTLMGEKAYAERGGVLAMVKRGGEFNPDHGGWEWLMLSPEGNIIARAPNLMNDTTQGQPAAGACNACHQHAQNEAGSDYTFAKPSEVIATLDDFTDYTSWTLIGENTGDSAANNGAHPADALRRTYKKQATASPHLEAGQYPIGTTLVKEIVTDDQVIRLYGMVKRGGNYNSEGSGWEWFLIEPDLSAIQRRGDDLLFCNGCHSKAGTDDADPSFRGADFSFYHEQDPVPLP